jgi:hypothetical protein
MTTVDCCAVVPGHGATTIRKLKSLPINPSHFLHQQVLKRIKIGSSITHRSIRFHRFSQGRIITTHIVETGKRSITIDYPTLPVDQESRRPLHTLQGEPSFPVNGMIEDFRLLNSDF